ncbi:hypothetical protein MMC09_003719 [Bachmanniomyces sp. S44760]|nr:hypothetical protein [Bachmanniomyces sp. S44760]
MSSTTIAITKFVGTISLGLLTGVSYTLATLTLPTLLSLPTFPPARSTFLTLQAHARTQQVLLSSLASTSLFLAYALSPRVARHPYLLWCTGAVLLSGGVDFAIRTDQGKLEEEDVNGEVVREGIERWKFGQIARTGLSGLGFAMSVVGIWGDGF